MEITRTYKFRLYRCRRRFGYPMRFYLAAFLSLFLVSINSANSQTVDFVVKVATGISTISADYKVEIVDGISAISADQKWNGVGACSNSPSVTIEIVEGISAISADLKVEIVTGISAINADKIICISGADQLEVDLLKKLKLIE